MSDKIRTALLMMVAVQAAHSIEEYAFKMYELFPPMRFLYARTPELAKPAFAVSNAMLFLLGLASCWLLGRTREKTARAIIWIWVAIQLTNFTAHVVWAFLIGGYNPGLATAPLFVPLAAYLIHQLMRPQSHPIE